MGVRDHAGRRVRLAGLVAVLLAAVWLLPAGPAAGQGEVETRAERPVFQVIAGIAPGSRVNLRAGPATIFPAVATLGYGERVQRLGCQDSFGVRWCRVRTEGTVSVTGWVAARFLADALPPTPDDDLAGGPDFWVVRGLARGDLLNVRSQPSTSQGRVIATLREGEVVRNLGCRMSGQTRWCRIRSTTGIDVTGWVNGRFLREHGGPPPGAGGGAGGGAGPDFLLVAGLPPGDTLNLRAGPSTGAAILARLREGTRVRNLGCETRGQARWCLVRTTGATDITGWANARYLRETR
jgi:uncharacterized protein YraI